jgi:hypothetical protein
MVLFFVCNRETLLSFLFFIQSLFIYVFFLVPSSFLLKNRNPLVVYMYDSCMIAFRSQWGQDVGSPSINSST